MIEYNQALLKGEDIGIVCVREIPDQILVYKPLGKGIPRLGMNFQEISQYLNDSQRYFGIPYSILQEINLIGESRWERSVSTEGGKRDQLVGRGSVEIKLQYDDSTRELFDSVMEDSLIVGLVGILKTEKVE
tara:strand:- start:3435 stop:3830 length:396 start_codon:yes stop_codon:yes gene_type:complete